MPFETDYKNSIFEIARDINRESYPAFIEDYGVKEKTVDKVKVFSAMERHSDLKPLDSYTLINSKEEHISYETFERALYNMVYHQLCNLDVED